MANLCGAKFNSVLGGQILKCDLAEHDAVLSFHYDSVEGVEWRTGHAPMAVPYTPTGPLKKLEVAVNG
jgi:hypothetical protein